MKMIKQLKQCFEKIGVVCLVLLGEEPLGRISLRRQWLSGENTKRESKYY